MLVDRFSGPFNPRRLILTPDQVETARLRAASPYLLNPNGAPDGNPLQVSDPGMVQPLPTTAAGLIQALGSPAGWVAGDIAAIYLADSASPLVDSLGLGPNLVAAGGPLTGRECVGLPTTSFNTKVGVEFTDNQFAQFADAGVAFGDVAEGAVLSILLIFRYNPNAVANGRVLTKEGAAGGGIWTLGGTPTAQLTLFATGAYVPALVAGTWTDGGWCNAACVFDSRVLGAHLHRLLTDRGDAASIPYAGVLVGANNFCVGAPIGIAAGASGFQIAYMAFVTKEITSAMRATFWRAFSSQALGTPNSYLRANPLVVPISASRVACYAADQLAVGYSAGFSTDGNALKTGVVAEDGLTFEPIGSTDLQGTRGETNVITALADGPSGMRDGMKVTQLGAWGGFNNYAYSPTGGVAIVGPSNVAWYVLGWYKRATVNTTARGGMVFNGDAGGPEKFDILNDAASPADWASWGGTGTPVRPAHNGAYVITGANANGDDCYHAELALIKNRTTASLAWRRVGTAAAAVTSTQTLSMTNTGNTRYSPVRGTVALTISGFGLTNGATFLQYGPAAGAGSLTLDYNAGQLRLRIWDSAAALAVTVLCGALDATEWKLVIAWDSRNPVPGVLGQNVTVERLNAGASPTLLGTWAGAWSPQVADVTPLMVGCDAAGSNAARCLISLA